MPLSDSSHEIVFTSIGDRYREWSSALRQRIYQDDELQLFRDRLPDEQYFLTAVFVLENAVVKARAVLYENGGIQLNGEKTLLVGNYECIDDTTTAAVLLNAVDACARDHGFQTLLGPMDGSTWSDYRFITSLQERPFFTEPQQQRYYAQSWLQEGFEACGVYYSGIAELPAPSQAANAALAKLAATGVQVRPIDTEHLEDDLAALYPFVTAAFSHSPFYTPITEADFVAKFSQLKTVLEPDCTLLVFHEQQPVGFILCLPDHFDPAHQTLVVKTIARQPGFVHETMISLLGEIVYSTAYQKGYRRVVHAFMHEANRSRIRSGQFGGGDLRRYILLKKDVEASPNDRT